jgi:hypothetical protein
MRTGGFIPARPLSLDVFPGDFFQVRNGEMILLGNIFRDEVIDSDDVQFGNAIKLNPSSWDFSDGVSKPYSGRGVGRGPIEGEFEFSRQVLGFARKGSFLFRGSEPESVKILNWPEIEQQLIIRLTQTRYSFRELYVVTESVTAASWTLAISGAQGAELEIATDAENFGLLEIFGHHSSKTMQSKELEFYHREVRRKPVFFKAKKLVVQPEKLDVFVSQLIGQRLYRNEWAGDFFDYHFECDPYYSPQIKNHEQAAVLDMLSANELNPNTALQYFRWTDANTDDIEKLFMEYGA